MKTQEIAVGIITDSKRGIFITQRKASSHLAGYWEFPGGKLETGENVEQALFRELQEEIGIQVNSAILLRSADYCYSGKRLLLHFYLVKKWQGDPYGREGQNGQWVAIDKLNDYQFPDTNQQIIALLQSENINCKM